LNKGLKELIGVLMEELTSEELKPLSRDFFDRLFNVSEEYIFNLGKYLLLWRLMKVLQVMAEGGDIEWSKLTDVERDIVKYIERKLQGSRRVEHKRRYALVKFLKKYPKILASNGKSYGPFSQGDVALLPITDALTLEEKGVVEGIIYM